MENEWCWFLVQSPLWLWCHGCWIACWCFSFLEGNSIIWMKRIIWSNQFQPLPERKSCEAGELTGEWNTRTGEQMIELEIDTNACKGSSNEINYIEHVQAFISKFQTNIRVHVHGYTERSAQSLTSYPYVGLQTPTDHKTRGGPNLVEHSLIDFIL